MARPASATAPPGSLAAELRSVACPDAEARPEGAPARNRGDRSLVLDRRRIHCCPFRTHELARRRALRPCSSTVAALRTRANREGRGFAKIETALRWENDPRPSLSARVKAIFFTSDASDMTGAPNQSSF